MGLWAGLSAKPCIERVKLNEEPHIEPVKLDINKILIDFSDLDQEIIDSIKKIHNETEDCFKELNKQHDLLVLSELHKRGYDLLTLENSDCWMNTRPIGENSELERFYVDGVLVFTVKRKTWFDDSDGKYMIYSNFEIV